MELFDSALPRWPTFGVNLAGPVGPDGVDVWMPETNLREVPPGNRSITSIVAFASGIRGAMQNWHDNRYVELAGYRDRIVQVRFNDGEGGLNLNMPQDLIDTLSDRGDRAGQELVAHFVEGKTSNGQPTELTWNNHRRIRLRTALGALEDFAMAFGVGYGGDVNLVEAPRRFATITPPAGEHTYADLAAEAPTTPPSYAGFDAAQRALELGLLALLLSGVKTWATARGPDIAPVSPSLEVGVPTPSPTMSIGPRL